MSKLRSLLGLSVVLGVLGIAVAPALAWFEGGSSNLAGTVEASSASLVVPGGSVACTKLAGAYVIWTKSTTKVDGELVQPISVAGPHLLVSISKWSSVGTCAVITGGGNENATIKPCNFQVIQEEKGSLNARIDVASECVITSTVGCILKVPQAGFGEDENLTKVLLRNAGAAMEAAVATGGVTVDVNAICKAAGLGDTSHGKFIFAPIGTKLKAI